MTTDNQLLRDESVRPTDEIIAVGLGDAANKAFVRLADGLKSDGITLMDWTYYKDGKAWLSKGEHKYTTPRGANKVTPIFWLSIWDGFFRLAFFFSTSVLTELLSLPISEAAKELINKAKPMGKTMRYTPIVFDVKSETLLSDIYEIARHRKTRIK